MTRARLHQEHRFPDAGALAHALSGLICTDLREAAAMRSLVSLVVSGGATAVPLLQSLRAENIPWSQVCITLADERWVDVVHPDSNERSVREHLLTGAAAQARFVALKNPAATPEGGVEWTWRSLTRLPRPYDVVVLGMGEDGHFASLFPGSLGIARALDASAPAGCMGIHSVHAPHARLTQNLAALIDARRVVLHITGEKKWEAYQRAKSTGSLTDFPVRALIQQQQTPVDVFWSP